MAKEPTNTVVPFCPSDHTQDTVRETRGPRKGCKSGLSIGKSFLIKFLELVIEDFKLLIRYGEAAAS
jgi:hypothetical protein